MHKPQPWHGVLQGLATPQPQHHAYLPSTPTQPPNPSIKWPPQASDALSPAHRSGDVWHGLVKKLPRKGILYAYKVEGEGGWEQGHRWDPTKLCIDPYAPLIEGRRRFGQRDEVEQFRTKVRVRHGSGASSEHLNLFILVV